MAVVTMYGSKTVQFSEKQIKELANVLFARLTNPDNDMCEDDALIEIKETFNDLGINLVVAMNPAVVNVTLD